MPFEKLDSFTNPFGDSSEPEEVQESNDDLRLPASDVVVRKPLGKRLKYYAVNAIALPTGLIVSAEVSAAGLRSLLAVTQMPLSRLPISGAAQISQYQGIERLDLAILMAALLFAATAVLWANVFKCLAKPGQITADWKNRKAWLILRSVIAVTVLSSEAVLFYHGVAAEGGGGWTETPVYVPLVTSVLWIAAVAMLGAYHSDYVTEHKE
ncbi:hypothetical protein FF011L_12510 [Roseimaritima multifibrata]|uniref:DUF2975 domain-containing protein n=1 Tax=Roseimaritima multifibrata TaxID=1930274 RepID=A0A517MCA6_9BACT|nr:hypothetical protein [Roseimaritima multifibrata]QDS92505.1 hypothetical protein FF011L_12510 [Roseimaritima multifibrata]